MQWFHDYRVWQYRNTVALAVSLVVFVLLIDTPVVERMLVTLGEWGYVGAFVTGIFFVSTFTVAPAIVVLFHLAELFHPGWVALAAGGGAVVGDVIVFKFLRDRVFEELHPLFMRLFNHVPDGHLSRLIRTPYFGWFAPVVGAIIIASPLPDELGITLLGISRLTTAQFIALSFVLNTIGIFIVVLLARAL